MPKYKNVCLKNYVEGVKGSTEWVDTIPTGQLCTFTIWVTSDDFNRNKFVSQHITASVWPGEKD